MDDLDYRLIAELRLNGRASVPSLATILGVARGTVQSRIEKLVAAGTIAGFTVRLKDQGSVNTIRGMMLIELSNRNIKTGIGLLYRIPGFAAIHDTNGIWDIIAEIEVPTLIEFHRVVSTVRAMDGVAKSETHIFLGPA